ncbi:hypothetical protein [Ensifer adhaerens]|uniref:hypothetical protein n=1 Tax=Ensifer adhaerens TaxID=106592 RepID=UPI000CF078BD|nr:hypothetical protein [Ensifer adhaerens]
MTMDKEFLAREAVRLRDDPVFREALARIRGDAVERMIQTPAAETDKITELQALARACDRLPSELEAMIQSAQPRQVPRAV